MRIGSRFKGLEGYTNKGFSVWASGFGVWGQNKAENQMETGRGSGFL